MSAGEAGDRLADRVLLDELPGLHDVGDLLSGDGQDQRTLLRVELDQPLDLELQQRLANGGARNPDRLGQLALGEQRPTLVTALQDALLDVRVDAFGGGGCLAGDCLAERAADDAVPVEVGEGAAGMRTA